MNNPKFLITTLLGIALASHALATVLIFEPASGSFGNFAPLPQGYGSRVVAEVQDGFRYSLNGGATPNVTIQQGTAGFAELYSWADSYGDLTNVVFAQEPQLFQLALVADPGYDAVLNSFDMAAWPFLDYTIKSVQVANGIGSILYAQTNVLIRGAGSSHTHFDFTGVRGNKLIIRFDSTNVDSDDVGIDNITFSQVGAIPSNPHFDGTDLSGTNFIASGSGGVTNGTYSVLSSTNVTLSLSNWLVLATNGFDSSGHFRFTNAVTPTVPECFYIIRMP